MTTGTKTNLTHAKGCPAERVEWTEHEHVTTALPRLWCASPPASPWRRWSVRENRRPRRRQHEVDPMTWPRHADGLPPSKYVHGEHYPDQGGYYDASRQAFVSTRPKTLMPSSTTRSRTLSDYGWRDGPISTEEIAAKSAADGWKPSPHVEKLRRLRDSDRAEDRATYNRMSPRERSSVGYYETGLRAYVAAGRELPDGVTPPKD